MDHTCTYIITHDWMCYVYVRISPECIQTWHILIPNPEFRIRVGIGCRFASSTEFLSLRLHLCGFTTLTTSTWSETSECCYSQRAKGHMTIMTQQARAHSWRPYRIGETSTSNHPITYTTAHLLLTVLRG